MGPPLPCVGAQAEDGPFFHSNKINSTINPLLSLTIDHAKSAENNHNHWGTSTSDN
jgi:hypothetical protein